MTSKLIKGNINLLGRLKTAKIGDFIYIEPAEGVKFDNIMRQTSSYATRLNIKIKQTALKGLDKDDNIFKVSRIEVLCINTK